MSDVLILGDYGEHAAFCFDESAGVTFGFDLSADGCVKRGGRRQSFARLPELLLDGLFDDVFASHGFAFALGKDMGCCVNQTHGLVTVLLVTRSGGLPGGGRIAFLGVSGIRRRLSVAFALWGVRLDRVADLFVVTGLSMDSLGRFDCDLLAGFDRLTQPTGSGGMVVCDQYWDEVASESDQVSNADLDVFLFHDDFVLVVMGKQKCSATFAEQVFDFMLFAVGERGECFYQLPFKTFKIACHRPVVDLAFGIDAMFFQFEFQPEHQACDVFSMLGVGVLGSLFFRCHCDVSSDSDVADTQQCVVITGCFFHGSLVAVEYLLQEGSHREEFVFVVSLYPMGAFLVGLQDFDLYLFGFVWTFDDGENACLSGQFNSCDSHVFITPMRGVNDLLCARPQRRLPTPP